MPLQPTSNSTDAPGSPLPSRKQSGDAAPRAANDNRLQALNERANRIKAQIAAIEARDAVRRRKEDTRTKVLVGAAVLAHATLHEETLAMMRTALARAITAPRDRDFLRSRGLID